MPSLRSARRDARDLLKEARGLVKKHGKRTSPEGFAKVGKARDELEAAVRTNQPDQIVGLTRKLDELLSQQFGGVRKSAIRQTIESVGSAVLVALALRLFVIEMFKIPSGSMIPTLLIGDHLFISKLLYGARMPFMNHLLVRWGAPKRGDVIVFNSPIEGDKDLIKRVVGIPGDTVELRHDVVYINGVEQPREKLAEDFQFWDRSEDESQWFPGQGMNTLFRENLSGEVHQTLERADVPHPPEEGPYHVPPGSVFVLGDNRDNSRDSRFDGTWTVPYGNIKGKAFVIVFSWGKGGWWFCHGEGALCAVSGFRTDRFFKLIH